LKTGEIGSGQLSKSAGWLWPAFKIGELALAGFQNRRVGSGRLSKALCAAPRNLLSNRSKRFELADFLNLFTNSKAFHAKRQRIYLFNIKLKGRLQDFLISAAWTLSLPWPIKPYHFKIILISCPSPFKKPGGTTETGGAVIKG
jgi:hypothetical protein